jgi:hypothetical protein
MVDRPNLFIVGAPKCGTTALADYLREHPQVVMSWPKEPHFFSTDLPGLAAAKTLDEYLAMFAGISELTQIVGEASVNYLSSQTAIPAIRDFNPRATLIAMVRNPLTWLPSYHSQLVRVREEDVGLEEALQLQHERREGRCLPRYNRAPGILQYVEVGRFGSQVARLLECFPREQVKVLVYEDFQRDTKRVYEEVMSFLGVDSDCRQQFPVVNAARQNRYRWLATFTEKTPQPLVNAALKLKSLLGIRRWGVLDALRGINVVEQVNEPLSEHLRSQLIAEYRDDVALLSDILERDLTSEWFENAKRQEPPMNANKRR